MPDCGCRMAGGICSNCQEELYILTFQGDDMDDPVSDEFLAEAERQRAEIAAKQSGPR
jgi:hypothetical protein